MCTRHNRPIRIDIRAKGKATAIQHRDRRPASATRLQQRRATVVAHPDDVAGVHACRQADGRPIVVGVVQLGCAPAARIEVDKEIALLIPVRAIPAQAQVRRIPTKEEALRHTQTDGGPGPLAHRPVSGELRSARLLPAQIAQISDQIGRDGTVDGERAKAFHPLVAQPIHRHHMGVEERSVTHCLAVAARCAIEGQTAEGGRRTGCPADIVADSAIGGGPGDCQRGVGLGDRRRTRNRRAIVADLHVVAVKERRSDIDGHVGVDRRHSPSQVDCAYLDGGDAAIGIGEVNGDLPAAIGERGGLPACTTRLDLD